MIIKLTNLLTNSAPYTFLSSSKGIGVGTIDVKNTSQFSPSWAIQIGKTGEERSEVKILGTAAISGTTLIITGTTNFDHPADAPVYAIKFDQVVFTRSTSGTAGTATPITGGTVTITPDGEFTQYDDTVGLSSYAYKAYFQNSVTLEVSSESDWLTSSGFTFYSLAKMRERIKGKLFNSGAIKDDEQINDLINEWLEEMNSALTNVDKSYSMGTVNVTFGTSGLGTITSTDFQSLKRMWITTDGVDTYLATKRDLNDIGPNDTFNSSHPYYSWRTDDVFEINPHDNAGTAQIVYYKRSPVLVNDADELPFAMRSYTKSFVNYGLAEIYYKDDKDDKGDRYLARANNEKKLFISEMTPRNFTGVQTIQITDVITPDDDYLYL